MLSRQELGIEEDVLRRVRYQALFSKSCEQKISNNPNEATYRFEKKIDSVYENVKECCFNSVTFAKLVMAKYNLKRSDYIDSTSFNYHTVGWDRDREIGRKQSYESRLIFRHIGYIEKYRRYLLKKHEEDGAASRADLSRRLVIRIINYIELYQNSEICFQTEIQDNAAKHLYELAKKIVNSNYYDFNTRIELT
jgi:hypothetical protein